MAGIFTRKALADILNDEKLSPEERTEQIYSLYGRSVDDGFVSKSAAKLAQDNALEQAKAEWEKNLPKPDIKGSEEYKALQSEFDGYKAMQDARSSEDFRDVKPKFFETVYGMIKRGEGTPSVKDQLAEIRKNYDEYFSAAQPKPSFGSPDKGGMPKGEEGAAAAFSSAWGFVPKKS